jgi:hypothetical protein
MLEKDKNYHLTVKDRFAWIDEIDGVFVTKPRFEGGGLVDPGKYEFKVIEFNYPLIQGTLYDEGQEKKFSCSMKKQAAHGF